MKCSPTHAVAASMSSTRFAMPSWSGMGRSPSFPPDEALRPAPPQRTPWMHQHWGGLVFLHWHLPPDVLRSRIPAPLEIDAFDGSAWIGLTPFALWGARPSFLPPLGRISSSYELNVRTYVRLGNVPGVWFFSLEASNLLAVLGARSTFRLPYRWASMAM